MVTTLSSSLLSKFLLRPKFQEWLNITFTPAISNKSIIVQRQREQARESFCQRLQATPILITKTKNQIVLTIIDLLAYKKKDHTHFTLVIHLEKPALVLQRIETENWPWIKLITMIESSFHIRRILPEESQASKTAHPTKQLLQTDFTSFRSTTLTLDS